MTDAHSMLDAVERWCDGMGLWMLRETEVGVVGRIDALLVPVGFDAPCLGRRKRGGWTSKVVLTGVEIKANRADFDRGLKEGQFDRYAATLGGLYVATGLWAATRELPAGVGHMQVYEHAAHVARARSGRRDREPYEFGARLRCVVKRHPRWTDAELDNETAWRVLYRIAKTAADRRAELDQRFNAHTDKLGRRFGHVLADIRRADRGP